MHKELRPIPTNPSTHVPGGVAYELASAVSGRNAVLGFVEYLLTEFSHMPEIEKYELRAARNRFVAKLEAGDE